jgi:hypothetical protein
LHAAAIGVPEFKTDAFKILLIILPWHFHMFSS